MIKKSNKFFLIIFFLFSFIKKDIKSEESKKITAHHSIIETAIALAGGAGGAIGLQYLAKKGNLASKIRIEPFNKIFKKLEKNSIKKVGLFGGLFTFLPYSAYKIHHYFKKRKLKGKKEEEEEEEEEEEKKIKEKKEEERKKQAEKEYANFFTSDKKCSIIMESHIFYSLLSPDNKKDNCIEIIHLIKSFFRKKNIPCEFSPNIAIACLGNTINQEKENNKFLKQSIPSAALYIINSEALFKAKIREEVDPYKLYQFTQKTVSNHSLYCLVPLCFKNNKILIDQNKEFIIDNINLDYEDTINKNAKHTLDLKEPQIVIRQGLNIQEIESFIHFEKAAEEFD